MREMVVQTVAAAVLGFLAGSLLCCLLFLFWRRKQQRRIESLTEYLEQVNIGGGGILPQTGEDDFSRLQDEIYKTVTELYQTREKALTAKSNFAGNLYNIAHQIRTPITSASLSLQMFQKAAAPEYIEQVKRQLSRLTYLEESLLLLSRIDSGVLSFEPKPVDVFTLLELSADNMQELFRAAGVMIDIEESGEVIVQADMEWTMEAVMNLLKNCMEHTPRGGKVTCSYEQNPIYTRISVMDTGDGFAKEDIPRLFDRFYRGKNAKKEGIGIGLALAKAIIEKQNGVIKAVNRPEGGACFEIRFYRH